MIMEGLPLILELALLLLWVGLSQYMWGISRTVTVVIIGVTSFGLLFYAFIVVVAVLYDYCPFQTCLSLLLRRLINFLSGRSSLWLNSRPYSYFTSAAKLVSFPVTLVKRRLKNFVAHSSKPDPGKPFLDVEPIFEVRDTEFTSNRLDARCVMWLRDASTDPDVSMAALHFISEVEWSASVDVIPSLLPQLATELQDYGRLVRSYPAVIPSTQDKAYPIARAFLHLYIQRCLINGRDVMSVEGFRRLPENYFNSNKDLQSTLSMINYIVANEDFLF
jgi:hypothetical protein